MATLATPNSFNPMYEVATITRPVACSLVCDDGREAKDLPRPRLTPEQVFLLEKHFNEKPRPPAALRLAVAQQTGLSMQRVGNWFQNRRGKAKLQKRQEEIQVMQVLESAGRRRAMEPSSPANLQEVAPSKITKPLGRRRSKSDTATARLNTSVAVPADMRTSSSPYSSPTEASYASLARSLAQASVAVRQASFVGGVQDYSQGIAQAALSSVPVHTDHYALQNIETPWQQPNSAFSDWGSSRNSMTTYTPTPAGQLENPFEFDSPINNQNPASPLHSNVPMQDNFDMFAAAIEMNRYTRPFVMPAFPTNGLMRRRKLSPFSAERIFAPPTKDHRDTCPPEVVDAVSTSHTQSSVRSEQQHPSTQSSIAARRKQSCPSLLGNGPQPNRGGSLNGAEEITLEANLTRQSPSDAEQHSRAPGSLEVEPAPFNLNIFNFPMSTGCNSPKHSSPRKLESIEDEGGPCCSPTPRLKQGPILDLEFTTSATPESATFDNHIPPVEPLLDTYHMHLPEDQLYVHAGFSQYHDFTSEGSSASSGILLGRETNAFPFEEFLQARLTAAKVKPLDALDSQQAVFYNQVRT